MRAIRKSRAIAILALLSSKFAFAQGCALCYTQAASASGRFIHALRSGIFVLVFPPLLISLGLATAAYRKRNQFQEDISEETNARDSNSKINSAQDP
ncbi:MAG TPA: hypothetical protein VGF44_01645 [Terriglobales bacterium]